jgi:hypothetical protein
LRVRTDFFSRPPRIPQGEIARMWREQEGRDPPFVDARTLAELKKTNRERDYAVIGELARLLTDPRDRILLSRSARELLELAAEHPQLVAELAAERPLLRHASSGREALERELDAERRQLIRASENRLKRYADAAGGWAAAWPEIAREITGRRLLDAHSIVVRRAEGLLPDRVGED